MANNKFKCSLKSTDGVTIHFSGEIDLTPVTEGDSEFYKTKGNVTVNVTGAKGINSLKLELMGGKGLNVKVDLERAGYTLSGGQNFVGKISSPIYVMIRNKTTSKFEYYDQYAVFKINNTQNKLCPINKSSKFRMTFYKAFMYQNIENGSSVMESSNTGVWAIKKVGKVTGSVVPKLEQTINIKNSSGTTKDVSISCR